MGYLLGILMTLLVAFGSIAAAADLNSAAGAPASAPPAGLNSSLSNRERAQQLVATAINLTDSARAVNMLWQATKIDPTYEESYIYLALYYNSRSQFDRVVQVYQQLVKYAPNETSAWLNIGEAYMSFSPPRFEAALPYYRKAFELDPKSPFAALRLGEIYAQENNRAEALKYLRLAGAAGAKDPEVAAQAEKIMRQIGS